jgi:hypothetical protein
MPPVTYKQTQRAFGAKPTTSTQARQQAAATMQEKGITSLSGAGGSRDQTLQDKQEDFKLQQTLQNAGITNNQQEDQIKKEKEEAESLSQKGKDIAQGIMTTLMGGGEDGNLNLTREEAYANLPAGMHPLRKQYEYLKEKYGPNWANTTQAKVLEGYLSGVPVERGGGLGAFDSEEGTGGAGIDPNDPGEKVRRDLLEGIASGEYNFTMDDFIDPKIVDYMRGRDIKGAQELTPEQYFKFRQQLMAADPTAENQGYKDAFPFSSGAGLSTLFEKFAPLPLKAIAGMFPERDLSGFENYADYEQAGAGFRPLPAVEQSNTMGIGRPNFTGNKFPPDAEVKLPTPVYPRYPLPGDPKRPPFGPPFMPDGGNFPLPVGINAFNPMFLGPSFRGSPYTNRGVSPAFYEALSRFA